MLAPRVTRGAAEVAVQLCFGGYMGVGGHAEPTCKLQCSVKEEGGQQAPLPACSVIAFRGGGTRLTSLHVQGIQGGDHIAH